MRDELVERVHSAIRAKLNHTPHMAPPDVLEECARAALAIIEPAVREECARVVEETYDPVGAWDTGNYIAAAIRAGAKP